MHLFLNYCTELPKTFKEIPVPFFSRILALFNLYFVVAKDKSMYMYILTGSFDVVMFFGVMPFYHNILCNA